MNIFNIMYMICGISIILIYMYHFLNEWRDYNMTNTETIDKKYYKKVAEYMPTKLPRPTLKITHYPSGEDPT